MTDRVPGDPYVELADRAVHDRAVHERREVRTRREVAAAGATWAGTLLDLAERGAAATVLTAGDRRYRGAVVAVATDHLVLRPATGGRVLVALDTVRAVRPEPGQPAPPAAGDRAPPGDRTLADALDRLAEDAADLALVLGEVPEPLQGRLVAVGEDVLTLRVDGRGRGTAYVPIEAIGAVLLEREPPA